MNTEQCIIDKRFIVDFTRNLICDKKADTETKFEPRLGNLLFILIQKRGEVVTREFLIKEIWDNYLGANEALNQAISFLRKLLDDSEKKIIQTIPKKGYSLDADISQISNKISEKQQRINAPIIAAALFLIFSIGAFYLVQTIRVSTKSKQASELTQKEMSDQDAKNKAIQNSDTRIQPSSASQNQQSEATLIEMSKEDAKRKTVSNFR